MTKLDKDFIFFISTQETVDIKKHVYLKVGQPSLA